MAVDFSDLGPCESGDDEWHRRMQVALNDPDPFDWYWMSFVSGETGKFLGVSMVCAPNQIAAGTYAHWLGCNPGGEIAFFQLPDDLQPKLEYRFRLISGDEAKQLAGADSDVYMEPRDG